MASNGYEENLSWLLQNISLEKRYSYYIEEINDIVGIDIYGKQITLEKYLTFYTHNRNLIRNIKGEETGVKVVIVITIHGYYGIIDLRTYIEDQD